MLANNDISGQWAKDHVGFRLDGRSVWLDRRIHAVRSDLADISLAGLLFAPHYAKAMPMHCISHGAFVHGAPSAETSAVTQLLQGETFHLLDITGGWAWGYCGHDTYVGYVKSDTLAPEALVATHRVTARTAPLFARADIKAPVLSLLSAGARISGEVSGNFVVTAQGAMHLRHLSPVADFEEDWVKAAEAQIGQPYIWGARGAGGIDCSGLVQIALAQAGIHMPRDSDMQRNGLGAPIPDGEELRRGDLVFFPGHVGIMTDAETLLHANAWWMSVVREPLSDVIARLRPDHEQPVIARRRIEI